MPAERVTVSLPADLLQEARGRVAAGEAEHLSAFVASALRSAMSRTHALAALDRIGRRPPADVLAAVRHDLGLGPITDTAATTQAAPATTARPTRRRE